ncbi:MAG: NADPH-dependent F420 reductase [Actinomycetes bacterium]
MRSRLQQRLEVSTMRIAIIGVGNVGSALARACVRAGHAVVLSATSLQHAAAVAVMVGAEAAESNSEAVKGADLVVLAVPPHAISSLVDEIGPELVSTVLVDPTNSPAGNEEEAFLSTGSTTKGITLLLPDVPVVKAFNTIFASHLNDPVVDGVPLDGFYAGDDEGGKAMVGQLLGELGFRPVDAGGLPAAVALEHMASLNLMLNLRNGWPWQSGWKLLGPTG